MKAKYIPENKKHTLLQFKYKGGTDSLLYQHLWSPFAEYLLNYFPLWVAPNLITFAALLLLLITHIIFMLPDDEQQVVADWKLIMMAIAITIYQHLDNIDGKQARRTNSSTPLGMLFDHGSDAISAFLISSQMLKIFGLNYYMRISSLFGFIMLIYFIAMWSQYSVGYFRLGRINPVDEGIPAYALTVIIFTQIDLKIFQKQHIFGTIGQQIIYSLYFLLVPLAIFMTKDIIPKSIRPLKQVLLMPILYISTGITLYCFYCWYPQINHEIYHCLFYTLIAMWARNMILIQFQFITDQKYNIFNIGTNFFILTLLVAIIMKIYYIDFPLFTYLIITTAIQIIILLQFSVSILQEGAQILQIKIFSVKSETKQQ